jgi:malate dehydrogenase (oxaloacetate-decarboxylating)
MPTKEEYLAKARLPAETAMRLHPFYRGKIQMAPKCPIRDFSDFAVWYTPGVAAPCRAIQENPETVYEHTNKANTIAVVSDGTRVLGLGDIGPEAGLPVMEGKSLLFKYLGGVDAVPLCLRTKDAEELIRTVRILEPSFGGINLEDIAQPKCFHVLDRLRSEMHIPVWHDDQQGSATVLLAGLINALKIVDKRIDNIKIAMIGMGAANVATYRLLKARGVPAEAIIACDSKGTLHKGRADIERNQADYADKWRVCQETNAGQLEGGIGEALRGADVCIAFSAPGPDILQPEWIATMAKDAVVFVCANPVPEIWPWDAKEAGAKIVATGRSDLPNQINNSLAFPGIFRGALDVRARNITDEMALAAADELATAAAVDGIDEERIVCRMDEAAVFSRVAVAVAIKAQELGIAALTKSRQELEAEASQIIRQAQELTRQMMRQGFIASPPS